MIGWNGKTVAVPRLVRRRENCMEGLEQLVAYPQTIGAHKLFNVRHAPGVERHDEFDAPLSGLIGCPVWCTEVVMTDCCTVLYGSSAVSQLVDTAKIVERLRSAPLRWLRTKEREVLGQLDESGVVDYF